MAGKMNRRNVDILCVPLIKYMGSKDRNTDKESKLPSSGTNRWRNGTGLILKESRIECIT